MTLILHFGVTCMLAGLILTIQVVHYPSFHFVTAADFARFSAFHGSRITWIVGPLMIAELLLTAGLLFDASVNPLRAWAAAFLLGVIWLSTAFLQVPLHGVLAQGSSPEAIDRLVSTNWIRTVAWVLKAGLLGWELVRLKGR